jgi:hypothetical protein
MNNIETNHTIEEYMSQFGDKYLMGDLWDFEKQDFNEGIEFKDNIVYWLINDRYYETTIPVCNKSNLNEQILKENPEYQQRKKKKRSQKYPVHYIGMFGYGPLYNNGSLVPPTPSTKPEATATSATAPAISAGSTVPPTSPVGQGVGSSSVSTSASASSGAATGAAA